MAKKKRTEPTTAHVISTLVYIRHLTDALIATLMAQANTDYDQLPPPLSMEKPWAKDCPPPPYRKDCAPPPYRKDCPPPEGGETVEISARATNCPTYRLVGPIKAPRPLRPARKRA